MPIDFKITLSWVIIVVTVGICTIKALNRLLMAQTVAELQKRADRADQSVLFFLAGANFWESTRKTGKKHAKTGEKQAKNRRFFSANFFGGKIGRC